MWVKSIKAVGSSEEQERQHNMQNVDKTIQVEDTGEDGGVWEINALHMGHGDDAMWW